MVSVVSGTSSGSHLVWWILLLLLIVAAVLLMMVNRQPVAPVMQQIRTRWATRTRRPEPAPVGPAGLDVAAAPPEPQEHDAEAGLSIPSGGHIWPP
jgi:hypothetical protein